MRCLWRAVWEETAAACLISSGLRKPVGILFRARPFEDPKYTGLEQAAFTTALGKEFQRTGKFYSSFIIERSQLK